jgi:phage terminase Nu1 subunit (DNA packaging protein)
MPLLLYAPISRAVALSSASKPMRGRIAVFSPKACGHICTHHRDMAAGWGTAPSQQHKARRRARLVNLQADAVEVRHVVRRGALVDAEAVAAEWSGFCARFAPEC